MSHAQGPGGRPRLGLRGPCRLLLRPSLGAHHPRGKSGPGASSADSRGPWAGTAAGNQNPLPHFLPSRRAAPPPPPSSLLPPPPLREAVFPLDGAHTLRSVPLAFFYGVKSVCRRLDVKQEKTAPGPAGLKHPIPCSQQQRAGQAEGPLGRAAGSLRPRTQPAEARPHAARHCPGRQQGPGPVCFP